MNSLRNTVAMDSTDDYRCGCFCKMPVLIAARILSVFLFALSLVTAVFVVVLLLVNKELQDKLNGVEGANVIIGVILVMSVVIPAMSLFGTIRMNGYWFIPYMAITLISLPNQCLSAVSHPQVIPSLLLELWFLHIYWRCFSYLTEMNKMKQVNGLNGNDGPLLAQMEMPPPEYATVIKNEQKYAV